MHTPTLLFSLLSILPLVLSAAPSGPDGRQCHWFTTTPSGKQKQIPGYLSCCAPAGEPLNKTFPTAEQIANRTQTIESLPGKVPDNLVNAGRRNRLRKHGDRRGGRKHLVRGIVDGVKRGGNSGLRKREEKPLGSMKPILNGTQPTQPTQLQKHQQNDSTTQEVAPHMKSEEVKQPFRKSNFKPWWGPEEEENRDRKAPVIEKQPEIDGEKVVCIGSRGGCEYKNSFILMRGWV
ncbi:hypothetical protein BZA77DRAFT_316534 [Pyronema omphalodes]|nr:hypothetical protein BZA77DRAFT_316534 [Pyronema omphalodes]